MLPMLMILGLAALFGTSESQTGCYGNVNNIDTTGASCATASPEGLSYCGVRASEKIAERDLYNMNKYKTIIKSAGATKCVDPSVIAAIISRESHAGTILSNGWGDNGNGFGLMQVDRRYHTVVGAWNSETHVLQGTGILVSMIQGVQKKFPSWTKDQQLKGGISAYNAGLGNVQTYPNMDIGTTHNDYANDVVARANFMANKDLKNLTKYEADIKTVGKGECISPSLIAAIMTRESHAGTALEDGWGDSGNGFGLMQGNPHYYQNLECVIMGRSLTNSAHL